MTLSNSVFQVMRNKKYPTPSFYTAKIEKQVNTPFCAFFLFFGGTKKDSFGRRKNRRIRAGSGGKKLCSGYNKMGRRPVLFLTGAPKSRKRIQQRISV